MRGCAREICLLCNLHDINLTVLHIPGVLNQAADILSRAHLGNEEYGRLRELEHRMKSKAVVLPASLLGPPTFI